MEARKNPKTDAQRDQYLAVCRHTHDNIIFNYGSVENYIVAKNTEINTAESKLQSYYDNPRKGKSRRPAIIAGLENTIFIMKNSLTNALRDLEELDAARATETPQISTETAETVNVSAEGEKEAERANIEQNHSDTRIVEDEYRHRYKVTRHWLNGRVESIEVWDLDHTSEPPQSPENRPTAADVVQMVKTELAQNKAMRTTWKLEFPDGTECNTSHKCTVAGCDFYEYTETRNGEEAFKDYKATERDITLYICQLLDLDAPQSPETPQTVECTTEPCKLAQTA